MNNCKKIIITGKKGIGKSTLAKKYTEYVIQNNPEIQVSGFVTKLKINRDQNRIVTFEIINNSETTIIGNAKKAHRMSPCERGFHRATELLKEIKPEKKLLFLDELGFLESNFIEFQTQVFRVIEIADFTIAVIKQIEAPFINKIRSLENSKLIEVTIENRDKLDPYQSQPLPR